MKLLNLTTKRFILYVIGLFFLSLGISFSIQADLGVSPVSSIAYALTLVTSLSVGLMTIITHVLFSVIQIILNKRFCFREAAVQLLVVFLFGFFVDATLSLVKFLPAPSNMFIQFLFLGLSLLSVALGLFGYMNAKFPLIPYDELTYVISEKFKLPFSKAKISSDLTSVAISAIICLIYIQSLGSIGIGTLIATYFVGKILGLFRKYFQKYITNWLNNDNILKRNVKKLAVNHLPSFSVKESR